MITTLDHRLVGRAWYWVIVILDELGHVLVKVMDSDFITAIRCASEALIESSIEL